MPAGNPPGKVTIYNVTITTADTEYSQLLPDNTKSITVQLRTAAVSRIAFETGKVATPTAPYFTIKSGAAYSENNINLGGKTLYVAGDAGTELMEIICYHGG